jgi:hypothetical protein
VVRWLRLPVAALVLVGVLIALALAGCVGAPAEPVRPAVRPALPINDSPRAAVRSYLDWVTYAYRIGRSDVATPTVSAEEAVRVDAYLQKNALERKRLDQTLVSLELGAPSAEGSHTLVPTKEEWRYRYLELAAEKALTPYYTVSYDATYDVGTVRGSLVVFDVEATPHGEVK